MFRCFLVKCMFLVFVHLSIPVDEGNIVSVDCGQIVNICGATSQKMRDCIMNSGEVCTKSVDGLEGELRLGEYNGVIIHLKSPPPVLCRVLDYHVWFSVE